MIPIERVERVELRDPNPIANTPLHLLSLSQVELELPPTKPEKPIMLDLTVE